jgi:hypothetical protein
MKRLLVNSLIALALIISSVSFSVMPALAVAPLVSTSSCTGFSSSTAIINGQLTSLNGGAAITSYGFDYGVTIAYGSSVIVGTTLAVGSKYWANLSGLTAATVYHYRAKVYNGTDWGYGSDMTFSTQGTPSSIPATTTTTTTTNNLATITPKNPPIDADKVIYEDSTTGDSLVTSTWSQVKAFLKTYFDTVYSAYGATGNVTANGTVGAIPQFSTTTNITPSIATGNSTFITVAGGLQANSAQINGATSVLGDVNFNKYKAVAMSCDNGATLPSSPSTGQWFLHTPTGRTILMQYIGGAWYSEISIGTMTLYVDPTGTDDAAHGTGTGTNAFLTVQYAVNTIPPIYGGNIVINVAAGTFNENVVVNGKAPSGNYNIQINGTLSSSASGTASAKTTGANAAYGTITDAAVFGSDYSGKMIYITATGEYLLIKSVNTGTKVATIQGYFADNTNMAYTVYDWATTIYSIKVGPPVTNLALVKMKLNGSTSSNVLPFAGMTITYCNIASTSTSWAFLIQQGYCYFTKCVATSTTSGIIYGSALSYILVNGCYFTTASGTGTGINLLYMSFLLMNGVPSTITGTAATKQNIAILHALSSNADLQLLYHTLSWSNYALYVYSGSEMVNTSNRQESNNTFANVVETASYSYVN